MATITSTRSTTSRREIPRWQIAAILVGFPALFMANSFTPWSKQLFGGDQNAWLPFWGSTLVLWWASVAAAVVVMRRNGWTLRDAGIDLDRKRRGVALAIVVALGAIAVALRESFGTLHAFGISRLVDAWSETAKPHTAGQRVLWILFGVISAAVCEEFVFRGFGFHALRSREMRVGLAAVLASLAWIGVHGLGGVFGFPMYAGYAVVLTGLVVVTGSLVPSMAVHSAIHIVVILGS